MAKKKDWIFEWKIIYLHIISGKTLSMQNTGGYFLINPPLAKEEILASIDLETPKVAVSNQVIISTSLK